MGGIDKDFKPNAAIAAQIEKKHALPEGQHNEGQPVISNMDKYGNQRSKLMTDCKKKHSESLKCIEENYERRELCQPFFDAYKLCRKEEHERRLEENYRLSGGNGDGKDELGCVIC